MCIYKKVIKNVFTTFVGDNTNTTFGECLHKGINNAYSKLKHGVNNSMAGYPAPVLRNATQQKRMSLLLRLK